MTRRPSITIILVVMFVCFIIGVLTVLVTQPDRPGAASPTNTPTFVSPQRPDQQTIILLGVDDFSRGSPELEAVWFATYRLPAKDIFLFGMPVDLKPYESSPDRLGDLFAWNLDSGVDPAFLQALHEVVPLAPNAVVVLDEKGFGAIIDYLGGIEVNGAMMDGAQVVGVVGLLRDNPAALLSAQQHFVESMAAQLVNLEEHPDLTPLLAIIPEHAYLSVEVKVLVDEVAPLLPLVPAMIHTELPWAQPTPAE